MSRRKASLLLTVALLGCGGKAGPTRWVVANVHPAEYPTARALRHLADEVAKDPVLAEVALSVVPEAARVGTVVPVDGGGPRVAFI